MPDLEDVSGDLVDSDLVDSNNGFAVEEVCYDY